MVSKIDFINMGYMFGMLVGSFVMGIISDKLGRRKALLISAVFSGAISLAGSFVSSYWAYFVLRLLLGIGSKGLFMIAFMICVEISGVDYKTYLGILIQVKKKKISSAGQAKKLVKSNKSMSRNFFGQIPFFAISKLTKNQFLK